jgi:hypothetical protein
MATQTVKVAATSTVTTIATPIASIIEVSKTATPEIRSCNGSCDETFTLTATLMSGGALPGWITFSSTNRNVAVDPLTSAAIGVWNIKITQNTVSGFDPTTSAKPAFESLRLTVLCEVSAFANQTGLIRFTILLSLSTLQRPLRSRLLLVITRRRIPILGRFHQELRS